MKRKWMEMGVGVMVMVLLIVSGCAKQPKTANSSEAIAASKQLESVEKKVQYLASEAQAFLSQEKYQEAINTAQYILNDVDQNSKAAMDVIEKAKAQLTKMAGEAAAKVESDVKGVLGGLGK
ncbi:MAG TPA: hypothetical protein VLJ10_00615 [Candidatus Bathyarchaeia archaeon]|nr:hypothetical protein [Candidatus Bathyarchaeia archaeon]